MVGGNVDGPIYEYRPQPQQPQLYYPKEHASATVQQQQQQQYPGAPHSAAYAHASNGGVQSAIPAPQGFQHQPIPPHVAQPPNHSGHYQSQGYPPQQISQPNGQYASVAPPNIQHSHTRASPNPHQQLQQQQQQQYQQQFQQPHDQYQEGWQDQSYYQHHAANATRNTYSNDPAFLADDFQQMSMHPGYSSGTRTPVSEVPARGMPAQHLSLPAGTPRQRELRLENDYDNDDGSASGDIDVSLFPSNPAQVTNLGRSERYAAAANTIQHTGPSSPLVSRAPPAASIDAGADVSCGNANSTLNPDKRVASHPQHTARLSLASNPRLQKRTGVALDTANTGGVPLRKSTTLYVPHPNRSTKPESTPTKVQFRSTVGSSLRQTQQRHTRRLPLGLCRSSTVSSSVCAEQRQPCKGKHIRRHQLSNASSRHRQPNECDMDEMEKGKPQTSFALQPLTPMPPRWRKSTKSPPTLLAPLNSKPHYQNNPPLVHVRGPLSGMSGNASPHAQAPSRGPYDNGFDSSSDRVHLGIRPATSQQNLNASHSTRVGSGSYDKVSSNFLAASAMYRNSASGDALVGQEPPLQPYAGMRPWTSSSRSLPLGTGQPQSNQQLQVPLFERDAPSSSASSMVGVPPMASMPSAKAPPPSSPKAPPPTAASLEAYRASVKRSSDTEAQLEFAKYVLEHAKGIAEQERNPKLANKRYEVLVAEGLKWVKKLAGGGITVHRSSTAAEAQFFLGTIHSRGIYGVERDDTKAFSYYQQASKSQHAEANYRTAVCYEVGVGTRRDPTRALQFYRKSAAQSNVPAMYKLGLILIKGLLGAAASPREGITWLKRAAENATPECPHGLHELALCHETDDIPGILQDLSYSRELYIKAGKLGYLPSQVRLGQAYEYGTLGCPIDARKSIGWYTRAAEKNDADAELALSGWYLTGADPFLPQNDVEAYLWARRAADRGLAKAEYAVGYYYECGIGVTQPDVKEAQKWYAKAAQQQNRRALSRLKELRKMGVNGAAVSKAARPRRNKGGSMF
ncbi:hypothetical protein LPJ81_001241 [Coemansia sp. IMI 209127]|nr:hypothetical protein LPJ81_001241 [Coemansia sp. IMI 209127]